MPPRCPPLEFKRSPFNSKRSNAPPGGIVARSRQPLGAGAPPPGPPLADPRLERGFMIECHDMTAQRRTSFMGGLLLVGAVAVIAAAAKSWPRLRVRWALRDLEIGLPRGDTVDFLLQPANSAHLIAEAPRLF